MMKAFGIAFQGYNEAIQSYQIYRQIGWSVHFIYKHLAVIKKTPMQYVQYTYI